jgi:hypothetical protein
VLLGARVASVLVLVGALVGLLWWWIAPVAQVRIESTGGYFVDPDPETYVASDVWFAGLSLAAGAAAGALLWRYSQRAMTAAVVGLAVGGLAGSLAGRWLGQLLGRVDPAEVARLQVGSVISVSLKLQAGAVLLVLPVAALSGWLVRDLVRDFRAARGRRVEGVDPGVGLTLGDPPLPGPPTST